jgi:hypothetical protein
LPKDFLPRSHDVETGHCHGAHSIASTHPALSQPQLPHLVAPFSPPSPVNIARIKYRFVWFFNVKKYCLPWLLSSCQPPYFCTQGPQQLCGANCFPSIILTTGSSDPRLSDQQTLLSVKYFQWRRSSHHGTHPLFQTPTHFSRTLFGGNLATESPDLWLQPRNHNGESGPEALFSPPTSTAPQDQARKYFR